MSPERVVWTRKQVSTTRCPKSLISGQSRAWLEEYVVRRRLRQGWPEELGARDAEAFLVLDAEWEAEMRNG
jgi:hypothetical protein